MQHTKDQGVTFGEWLLAQCSRDDALGDLASSAMADPKFPRVDSDEAAPSFREDGAPLFRDDVAPFGLGPYRH